MTGLRDWKNECSSKFCVKKECLNFLTDIANSSSAKYVFVSYNSDGLLDKEGKENGKMLDSIKKSFPNAQVELFKKEQIRYKSDVSLGRKYNVEPLFEYLFAITK